MLNTGINSQNTVEGKCSVIHWVSTEFLKAMLLVTLIQNVQGRWKWMLFFLIFTVMWTFTWTLGLIGSDRKQAVANVAGGLAPGRAVQPLLWQMSANICSVLQLPAPSIKIQPAGPVNLQTWCGNLCPVVNDRDTKAPDSMFWRSLWFGKGKIETAKQENDIFFYVCL